MGKKLTERVTWVGKVDWELKTFHGDELSTHRGSSYNSFLIRLPKNSGLSYAKRQTHITSDV